MVASITDQANLLTYTTVSDNELARLSTDRMTADSWARFHVVAWTMVKQYLADRRPTIAESDLDDTDELLETTCYAVLYLGYEEMELAGGSDQDKVKKRFWFRKFRKAFARVTLTVDGTDVAPECFANRRSYRG